ncbi:MAG: acetate--CoA ligase family protein [Gammaproteobacteria bacterium]
MLLKRLLQPKSIAVFGGREAREVVRQCQRMGFGGDIWPVHPTLDEVNGLRCYRSVRELPTSPDASFVGVNRHLTVEIIRELSACGAGGAVCYASGFGEVEDGKDLHEALLAAAGNMPILGPNCYGVINYLDGALLWPDQHGSERVQRGVAILTQSSNIGINLTMQARGLPIAYLIALGNQAQTDLAGALDTLIDDERVSAVGLYIEGFTNVPMLQTVMQRAHRRGLPVVAVKSGASLQGARITQSHTASMAGADEVASALLDRLGVARVRDLDTLIETLKLLHVHGPLKGNRLCSMSCSGGEASLMADTAVDRGVVFPDLTDDQFESISKTVHPLVSVSNPLDYHTFAWNKEEELFGTYQAMLRCQFDLSILVLDFPRLDRCSIETWEPAVRALKRAAQDTQAPTAVTASLPESLPESIAKEFIAEGIAPLCGLRQTLDAAAAAARIGQRIARNDSPECLPGPNRSLQLRPSEALDEHDAKELLRKAGITTPLGAKVSDLASLKSAASELTFPLALKVCDSSLLHKSELGAVHLGIENLPTLLSIGERLLDRFDALLVEEMIPDAVGELIVGINHDPVIGPWMMIGSGGLFAELLNDREIVLLPAQIPDLERAIDSLKASALIAGYRGAPIGDRAALIDALKALSDFWQLNHDTLVELEINPLLVRPQGKGVCAVDAVLRRTSPP